MENDEQEDRALLREWIGRLEAFSGALDYLEGESPGDFCESACCCRALKMSMRAALSVRTNYGSWCAY